MDFYFQNKMNKNLKVNKGRKPKNPCCVCRKKSTTTWMVINHNKKYSSAHTLNFCDNCKPKQTTILYPI